MIDAFEPLFRTALNSCNSKPSAVESSSGLQVFLLGLGPKSVLNTSICLFPLAGVVRTVADLVLLWTCVIDADALSSLLPLTRGGFEIVGVALVSFAGVIALTILLRKDCPTEGVGSSATRERTPIS